MLKKVLLPVILLVLAYGFLVSPNFKTIAAGVAIFLFGMLSLEEGFRAFTGGALERLLRRATATMSRSVLFGIVSTTLTQSSSLISVITISFISAGLVTLAAGIGIVFGANLGTTTGAWLIAGFGLKVNIAAYAMPMLVFGVVLIFQSSRSLKGFGYILAGLGFLFLGIYFMKEGFDAFKDTINLAEYAVAGYPGVLLFTAMGILATVVMQSSHATLVLTITALSAGQLTYENALALAIGANVGTTITAILGAISANENGKRLALAHLIFNVVTGVIAIAFIFQLVVVVNHVASAVGIAEDDYTLKLAVFHSIFNLLGILLMLPLTNALVRFLYRAVREEEPEVVQPKYLTGAAAEFPGTALEAVRLETERVYEAALRIIIRSLGLADEDVFSDADLKSVLEKRKRVPEVSIDALYEKEIKGIYSAVVAFIGDTAFARREEQSAQLQWLREASTQLVEAVKDTEQLQKNLRQYIGSEKQEMHDFYNRLRLQIAGTIRELEEARTSAEGVLDALDLDALKLEIEQQSDRLNRGMTECVARKLITPAMGSSVLNDSIFAHDISLNLVRAAQVLFAAAEKDLTQATRDVVLEKSDINQIEVGPGSADQGGHTARGNAR